MHVISMMDSLASSHKNLARNLIFSSRRLVPQTTFTFIIVVQGDISTVTQNYLVGLVKQECPNYFMTY